MPLVWRKECSPKEGTRFTPSAGADAVTFAFTPISSASNCQVGIACYEVNGLGSTTTASYGFPPWELTEPLSGARFVPSISGVISETVLRHDTS